MSNTAKSHIVVVGTVYPGVESYLCSYLDSLEAQSYNTFELLLANDGFIGLEKILSKRDLQWRIINVNKSVSCNRRTLINSAIEYGYTKIIFSDCDDELSLNRVEILNSLLNSHNVVVNDLDIIDASSRIIDRNYLSNRFKNGTSIKISNLQSGNMMGLTNTAATADVLKGCIALQRGETIAFDWYLWSTVLLNTKEAVFTNNTTTKYRTYSNNVAGLPQVINNLNVCKGLEVKREHYMLMSEIRAGYNELLSEFQNGCDKQSEENILKYISILQKKEIKYPVWWEQVMPPSEIGVV